MEEMVFLTIVTRSIGSARQMRPPSNPPKKVEATLRQTAERGTTLEVKAPLYLEGQGEALRARNLLHDPITSVSFEDFDRFYIWFLIDFSPKAIPKPLLKPFPYKETQTLKIHVIHFLRIREIRAIRVRQNNFLIISCCHYSPLAISDWMSIC